MVSLGMECEERDFEGKENEGVVGRKRAGNSRSSGFAVRVSCLLIQKSLLVVAFPSALPFRWVDSWFVRMEGGESNTGEVRRLLRNKGDGGQGRARRPFLFDNRVGSRTASTCDFRSTTDPSSATAREGTGHHARLSFTCERDDLDPFRMQCSAELGCSVPAASTSRARAHSLQYEAIERSSADGLFTDSGTARITSHVPESS